MIRTISIVLIVAIALQTVGCSSWRPLARANRVAEDDRQTSMRDQVLGKLTEGLAVRIRIRAGTHLLIKGEVIEGIIERVGVTSLTVTTMTFYAPGNVNRELTLHFSEIESIEYRESNRELGAFVAGFAVGPMVLWLLYLYALNQGLSD